MLVVSVSVSTSSCRWGGRNRGGGGDAEALVLAAGCGEERGATASSFGDCAVVTSRLGLSGGAGTILRFLVEAVVEVEGLP